jgi:hypothetical protein
MVAAVVGGTVRTQEGRPLAGAVVGFRAAGTGAVTSSTPTDAGGRFRFDVPSGVAGDLVVRRAGYSEITLSLGALAAGARRDVGVTLPALARLDVVTVVAERDRPLINTQDATTGGVISRRELQSLPTDARDPVTLGYTIPGVAQATGFFGDAPRLTINGQNSLYTQYSLDGLENNEGFLGGPRVEFPLAALQRLPCSIAHIGWHTRGRRTGGQIQRAVEGHDHAACGLQQQRQRLTKFLKGERHRIIPFRAKPTTFKGDRRAGKLCRSTRLQALSSTDENDVFLHFPIDLYPQISLLTNRWG